MLGGNTISEGLFHAAIMESNPMGFYYKDYAQADYESAQFLACAQDVLDGRVVPFSTEKNKNCDPKSTTKPNMEQITAPENFGKIMATQHAFGVKSLLSQITAMLIPAALPYSPVVDATMSQNNTAMPMTVQPLGFGDNPPQTDKDYIFGINHDEGALFAYGVFAGIESFLHTKLFDRIAYGELIKILFPSYAESIFNYPNGVLERAKNPYSAAHPSDWSTMTNPTAATSRVINDYAFRCGNLFSATQTTHGTAKTWAYLFQPDTPPFQLLGASIPPCNANNPDELVCHTLELPFVFNTFGTDLSGPTPAPKFNPKNLPSGMATLSQHMQTAWVDFAKYRDPTRSGQFPKWTPFDATQSQNVALMRESDTSMMDMDALSNCSKFWDSILKKPPHKVQ
jgi:carboxylesterase type B